MFGMRKIGFWGVGVSAVLGMLACGDDAADTSSSGPSTGSGASGAAGTGGAAASGNGASGANGAAGPGGAGASGGVGAGGGGPVLPVCKESCTMPSECGNPALAYFDGDNHTCDDGTCTWIGCLSDAECQAVSDFVCRDFFGIPNCVVACDTAQDCEQPAQSQDEGHWQCQDGGCRYLGCTSSAECEADFGPGYGCDTSVEASFCTPTCVTPADCDVGGGPAFDADNYECTDGFCRYTGCTDSAECMASNGPEYVCDG